MIFEKDADPIVLKCASITIVLLACVVEHVTYGQSSNSNIKCVCKSTHLEDSSFSIDCRRNTNFKWNNQEKWKTNESVLVLESSVKCRKDRGPPPAADYTELLSKFYKLHSDVREWQSALRACAREGATLAVINSASEAMALQELFRAQPRIDAREWVNFQAWVGVNDLADEGDFVTLTGVPLEDAGWATWSEGEPNNRGPQGEDCVSFLRDGTLNDVPCAYTLPFFCERSY